MNRSGFLWLMTLACVASAMAIASVAMSAINERTQRNLQAQQAALNNGVLGPQGQQIGNAILQEMAASATTNRAMRALLKKHGYDIKPAAGDRRPQTADQRPESGDGGQSDE